MIWKIKTPKNKLNPLAMFCVSWDRSDRNARGRRSGNSWTSKAKAQSVYDKKLAAGLKPEAYIKHFAGFAF